MRMNKTMGIGNFPLTGEGKLFFQPFPYHLPFLGSQPLTTRSYTLSLSMVHLQVVPDLDGLLAQGHFIKIVGSTQLLDQR